MLGVVCALRDARRSDDASQPKRGAYWDHRRSACVHGLDDLGVVDALEVDRGDAEVAVAELALDDDQWYAFVRLLDCVRVAQLMSRETSARAGDRRRPAQLGARGGRRPPAPARWAGDDAEQRADRQLERTFTAAIAPTDRTARRIIRQPQATEERRRAAASAPPRRRKERWRRGTPRRSCQAKAALGAVRRPRERVISPPAPTPAPATITPFG